LTANPGGLICAGIVKWNKAILDFETIDLGQGIHYLKEAHPRAIGEALAGWIQRQKMEWYAYGRYCVAK
jgi:haloalkane dehalogenase